MIEGIAAGAISILLGLGAGYYLAPENDDLTSTDLAKSPCSIEYIDKYGDNLCRELFCRMSANSKETKTSGKECEVISNIINSNYVYKQCVKEEDPEKCFRFYRERK